MPDRYFQSRFLISMIAYNITSYNVNKVVAMWPQGSHMLLHGCDDLVTTLLQPH